MGKSTTAVNRSARLACAVTPAFAETVRDLAKRQGRTVSVFLEDLLREAVARRGESAASATTHASA